ncbi:LOW QUALITY PROTEIN: MP domain-containing protein, partial [Cephalotus follicularis]
ILDEKTIKELAKNFKYIHFALVQVTIKPLTRQGLNTSILASLRDARHLNFDDSLIGAIETSLCNGPVYFDGYPDLTISLTDKNILETLKINIKLHGYNMLPGSEIIATIHHVQYKATNSICPKSLVNLSKGETTMMKCVTNDSNILIPQKIKWRDINIPEDWSIQSDTIAPKQENIENTSLHSITQNEEGLIKIRFDKTVKTHPTTEGLKKILIINICEEKYGFQPHRASTSSIRSRKTNYFDTKTKLSEISSHSSTLKGIYTQDDSQNSQNDFQEINEPISPTYSEMKPPSQLMTILIDETFEINKDLIRKDFIQEKYLRKRYRFFQKYSEVEQNNIRTAWYEYMIKIKAHIMFFDYLPIYKNQLENKKYFTEEKIQKIFMNQKTTTTWLTSDNKIIEAIHPPSEKIQINIQNNQIQAAPFKLQNETSSNQTTQETNKIIEQNNYSNRHLQTLGSQLSRIENIIQNQKQHSREETKNQDQKIKPLFTPYKIPSSQIKQLTLNEINERLRQIVPDIDPLKIELLTSYYYRPTYPDLQIEERGKFTQAAYQSGTIYEWNVDGMNEYHIINKLQEMTMVSNAHKIKNNSDKAVANILIAGFTGQIKGWWDNVLT